MNAVVPNRSPLSAKELNHVVTFMSPLDQISFSLVSKATKSIIVSRKLFPGALHLEVQDTFKIGMYTTDGHINLRLSQKNENWNGADPVKLIAADIVEVEHETKTYYWRKEGFGIKDWIYHIKEINHSKWINQIMFYEKSERIETDSVLKTIGVLTINHLLVSSGCSERYRQLIYQKVHTKNLRIFRGTFQGNEELKNHFIQNYNHVGTVTSSPVPITLNDLLILNCQEFHTEGIPMKTINRFLKIWRKGCKSRLKKLSIGFPRTVALDENVILKGIEHVKMGNKRFKIYGANGIVATVSIHPQQSRFRFAVSKI
ncbi:unnamed protein product [Caenorhabditis brenneri]